MQLNFPGANYAGFGLPTNDVVNAWGFPVEGLIGLYLFDEGATNSAVAAIADRSGNGKTATNLGAHALGVKVNPGLECQAVNGIAYDTGISTQRDAETVIVGALAIRAHVQQDQSIVNLGHCFLGSTADISSAQGGNSNQTSLGFSVHQNRLMLRDPNQWFGGERRIFLPSAAGSAGDHMVLARRINGPAGTAQFRTLVDSLDIESAAITANFTGANRSGNYAIGVWADDAPRPTALPSCRLYVIAIYDRDLGEDLTLVAMEAAGGVIASRGLTPDGF